MSILHTDGRKDKHIKSIVRNLTKRSLKKITSFDKDLSDLLT